MPPAKAALLRADLSSTAPAQRLRSSRGSQGPYLVGQRRPGTARGCWWRSSRGAESSRGAPRRRGRDVLSGAPPALAAQNTTTQSDALHCATRLPQDSPADRRAQLVVGTFPMAAPTPSSPTSCANLLSMGRRRARADDLGGPPAAAHCKIRMSAAAARERLAGPRYTNTPITSTSSRTGFVGTAPATCPRPSEQTARRTPGLSGGPAARHGKRTRSRSASRVREGAGKVLTLKCP